MERRDGEPARQKTMTPFMHDHDNRSRGGGAAHQTGFTLIEVLVVITIAVILLGVGVPSMRNIIITTRVKNASFDVYASILAARSDAITRNTTVTITPAGGNWAAGWTTTDTGGNTLKTQNPFPGITITGPATVAYNNAGRLNAAVAPFNLTAPGAIGSDGRCITIDLSGRPVVTTPAVPGVCP